MAATGYKPIYLNLNVETGFFIDSSGNVLSTEDLAALFYGNNFLLCITCYNNDLTAAAFDASDTFSLAIDPDFVRTDDSGALTAAHSGSKTQVTADGFSADPPDTSGSIRLTNSSSETFDFAYTSWSESGGVYTFTGASQDLTYSFAEDDDVDLLEPVMARSANSKFNVAGDWSALNVTGGKISVRVQCRSTEFASAIGTSSKIFPYCEIKKYYSGVRSIICQHKVIAKNIVDDDSPAPAQVDSDYRTASAQDSIDNLKQPKGTYILDDVALKTAQQNTVYTVPSDKLFKPKFGEVMCKSVDTPGTAPSGKWLADSTELMSARVLSNVNTQYETEEDELNNSKYWPAGTVFKFEVTSASTATTHTGKAILKGELIDV